MENVVIDDRYELLGVMGTGGEARVHRANDIQTGEKVAVRMALQPGLRHAPQSSPASHDRWVQLLSTGIDPKYGSYQVFELLEGQTLRQIVQTEPLSSEDWRCLVDQSLDAVESLHGAGWVHGDLNADNFFLTSLSWKLLELPFYRFEPPVPRSTLFGSIHTLAPEQFEGARPNIQTDVYSLGCLYYYAACGEYPHPGTRSQEVAIHCLGFAPEPLNLQAPLLPAVWSDWVMKLIERDPESRVANVAAARQLLGVAVA